MAHKHPIYDTDKHFVIDPITKKISTESTKLLLAQHSHNSERFTFEIPKEIEGHDMSLCNLVEIHYLNIDATNKSTKYADIYKVEDLKVGTDDTDVVFGSWLISGNATQYVGNLNFAIRFACIADDGTVEYSWPTLVYSNITVGETILNTESVVSENSDIIAQFEARIAALEENGGGGGGTVKTVNGIEPDENGNVDIEIPEVDLSGYAKTEDIPTIPENIVQTVNGIEPDENGNVEITIPDYGGNVDQSGGLSDTAKTLLITILRNAVYSSDQSATITALEKALASSGDDSGSGDDGGETEITLAGISATYSGGDVNEGTALTDLTGITVLAVYSDGSTETVTDYTLSGEIAEGTNTITVSYGGMTTTFTVTGLAEPSVFDDIAIGVTTGFNVGLQVTKDSNTVQRATIVPVGLYLTKGKTYKFSLGDAASSYYYGVQIMVASASGLSFDIVDGKITTYNTVTSREVDSGWMNADYEYTPADDNRILCVNFKNSANSTLTESDRETLLANFTAKEV